MPPESAVAAAHAPPRWRGRGAYIRQFIANTGMIGSVTPSSPQLAAAMIEGIDLARADAVLEFGPGTGVFTDAILPRLGRHTRFIAIELNDEMAAAFRKRHPRTPLAHESCENARRICDDQGIDRVDCILSGLPWASFPESLQTRILNAVQQVLRPGGAFVTFGYHIGTLLPAGKRFYRLLPSYFSRVQKSGVIWRNIPPAFVYRCTL